MARKKTAMSGGPDDGDDGRDDPDAPSADKPPTTDKPRFRCVQFPRDVERNLKQKGPNQEESLIDEETTPENVRGDQGEQAEGDLNERARLLVEEELKALSFIQKGFLGVYWVEAYDENRGEVARALYLPTTRSLDVTMFRALSASPCGPERGHCDHVPGCAHERGERLWNEIRRRVASKL